MRPHASHYLACRTQRFDLLLATARPLVVWPMAGRWSQLGSWKAVAALAPRDPEGNHVHGQGHTTIEHRRGDLAVSVRWCVDATTSVQQVRIRLTNHGSAKAHLRAFAVDQQGRASQRLQRRPEVAGV